MVQVIERTDGYYEAHEMEFGTVYRWCPECVVVECDCGKRLILTRSQTTCRWCGLAHATSVEEELATRQLAEETIHPWRYYADEHEYAGLPC